jgi:hypothetical protein
VGTTILEFGSEVETSHFNWRGEQITVWSERSSSDAACLDCWP